MRRRRPVVLALVAALGVLATARGDAGHELSFYPSFYPQDIRLSVLDPAAAGRLLSRRALHAYIGPDPFAGRDAPAHVAYAPSLASYIVLTFTPARGPFGDASARCAAAGRVARALAGARSELSVHPYPVTPYHGDYLQHVDLAQAAWTALDREAPGPAPRLRATGPLAAALQRAGFNVVERDADAAVEEISLRSLLAPEAARAGGWPAPPWAKEGWFHAYRLMAGAVTDQVARREIEATVRSRGRDAASAVERASGERRLVSRLTRGCERLALGYVRRRQALNDDYAHGVENVAYDAQTGLGSALFFRTVKLKDFPWNGWLRVGVKDRPAGAWNPLAGFTDETGRLVWSIVGDPAFLPAPRSGAWVANRVQPLAIERPGRPIDIPADALRPDPVTGALDPVGPGVTARARIAYRVLFSRFHDGTTMSPADVLYPFVVAVRWSERDPAIARVTALLRERLAGVRVGTIDTEIKVLDDGQVMQERPQIEVYLTDAVDPVDLAVVAPPWSTVPWPLIVLMEEAVARGLAAFSEAEARRRGVAWLDLVRDRAQRDRLLALLDGFERRAWVPEALRGLVTAPQARARWAALRRFGRQQGHLLVTNGPYRLGRWTADEVALPVFRDFSYPLGVGTYDRFAIPLRAFVARTACRGERIEIEAEIEKVSRSGRSYAIVREPFRRGPAGESFSEAIPVVHYTVLGPGDEVAALGTSDELDGDRLVVDLRGRVPPGAYRVALALAVNGNLVDPDVQLIPYRPGPSGPAPHPSRGGLDQEAHRCGGTIAPATRDARCATLDVAPREGVGR